MNESNERKVGAILSYLSIILNTLVQLLYTPLLIRMMGQSEYGLYSLISSIIGYLTILDLGFGNAIVVYTSKYRAQQKFDEEKKLHGMFRIVFFVIAIIATILGIVLYLLVPSLFGETMSSLEIQKAKIMMLILSFNLFITFIFNIYSSIITAYEKFSFQKILSILNTLIKPLIMIPLLFMGYKSITMALVITIINIAICLSNYIYCRKKLDIKIKYKGFDKKLFITIFGYSFFIFLGVMVDKINWSLDQFILGVVSGTTAVSIYSVATQINAVFVNLSTAISGVMLPKMSKMIAKDATPEELTNEMIKVGRLQNYIILLMATGIILVGKEFIIGWAGKEYLESYYVTLLLVIPVCFPLIQNLGLSIIQALNKHKFRSISTAIMAAFNIIISYFLAKKMGPTGAALGTTISIILCNVIVINIYYKKAIGLDIVKFWKSIFRCTIPVLIPIVIILLIMQVTSFTGLISVLIYGGIYTIMYCLTMYFLSMNEYEKSIIDKVISKFFKKKVKHNG